MRALSCHRVETPVDCVHLPRAHVRPPQFPKPRIPPMSFSMSKASLPALELGLTALSGVLDKAQEFATTKQVDPSVLLGTRLCPDMFALTRQVQVASDLAKNGMARLSGVEPPRSEDPETTIDQLKARLAKTVAFIKSVDPRKIDAAT